MDDTVAPPRHPVLAHAPDMSPDTATVLMCVDEICGRLLSNSFLRDQADFFCAYPIAALHNRDALTAAVTQRLSVNGPRREFDVARAVCEMVMSDMVVYKVMQHRNINSAVAAARRAHSDVWSASPRHVTFRTTPSELQTALARIPGTPEAGKALPDRGDVAGIEVWDLNHDTPGAVTGYDEYSAIWLMLAEYMIHRERGQLLGRDLNIDMALAARDDLDTVRLQAVPGKHFLSARKALQHAADELVPGAGAMIPWQYWAKDDEGAQWYTGAFLIQYDALSHPDASHYLIDRVGEELARLRAAGKRSD